MGMSGRLHGKMISLPAGKTATCKHCLRQYKVVRLVIERKLVRKICPFCARTLYAVDLTSIKFTVKNTTYKFNLTDFNIKKLNLKKK